MKKWKPIAIENSEVPVWVSKLTGINAWAVSFFIFIFCVAKFDDSVRQHETIHFQQQLELLFVFQWILYGLFWLIGLIKYRSRQQAYLRNPFEQEAYDHQDIPNYLLCRKRYSWWKYKI